MKKKIVERFMDGMPETGPAAFKGSEDECYQKMVKLIYDKREEIKKDLIMIGWCLGYIKEHKWYLKEGCRNIYDYADKVFHISRSETSRYIRIYQRFSKHGSDKLELDEQYEGYTVSQLEELLPVSDGDLGEFNAGMKVAEIRRKKDEILGRRSAELEKLEDHPDDEWQDGEVTYIDEEPDEQYVNFQPEIPEFKNKGEREKWLKDVENWGLWYEDKNIGARYYKYDFSDGSRLIAVKYGPCPPYMEEEPLQSQEEPEADGETEYHMIFSEWYMGRHSDICEKYHQGRFNGLTVRTSQIVRFLKELQDWEECHPFDLDEEYIPNEYIMKEFDPDHIEKADSYIGRKYAEFFKEKEYIPKYFNAKACSEIGDYAPTLATGCGSATAIGSVIIFDAVKEVAAVINDEELEPAVSLVMIKKVLRIAEPKERKKVENLLGTYGLQLES